MPASQQRLNGRASARLAVVMGYLRRADRRSSRSLPKVCEEQSRRSKNADAQDSEDEKVIRGFKHVAVFDINQPAAGRPHVRSRSALGDALAATAHRHFRMPGLTIDRVQGRDSPNASMQRGLESRTTAAKDRSDNESDGAATASRKAPLDEVPERREGRVAHVTKSVPLALPFRSHFD